MKTLLLFPLLLLAGCGEPADRLTDAEAAVEQQANIETPQAIEVPPPPNVAPPPAPTPSYKAVGSEPGWSLTVTPKMTTYEGDYGALTITEPTAARFRPVPGRYAGTRLAVTIAKGPCNDGMSDRSFRDTVTVTADGKSVSGCGGGTIEATPASDPGTEPVANNN